MMACCVKGYHVYKDMWAAAIGEVPKKVEGTKIAPNTTFRSFQRQQIKVNLRVNIATDEPSLKKPKKVWFF